MPYDSRSRILRGGAFLLLAFGLFFAPDAAAQGGPPDPAQRLERMMTALTQEVGLSDAQAAQIRPLLSAHIEKQVALRQQRAGQDRTAVRAEMSKLQQDLDARVEALLTGAQVEKYRAFREAQRARRGARRGLR